VIFFIKIDHYENVLFTEKHFLLILLIKRDLTVKNKFITFDIEACLDLIPKEKYSLLGISNNKKDKILKAFIPFACGFYDGVNSYKYYLTNYPDYKDMLKACILDMANPKYKDYIIYAHNGAGFDFIYVLDVLKGFNDKEFLGSPDFTSKDAKIIGFNVKIHNPLYQGKSNKLTYTTLKFRDSYKLLPHSLHKLTKEFSVECIKGTFPYLFPNLYNLNYIGNKPDIKFYDSISSIPIGAAITAWSRIYMTSFLFNPTNPCAYTDTDCGIFKHKLSDNFINDELGGWKLEHFVKEGIAVLPKMYTLETLKHRVTKNKGISGKLTLDNFKNLYLGKSLDLTEERWIKDLYHGIIYIEKIDIHINNLYNKRIKLYSEGNWVNTSPFVVEYDRIIPGDLIPYPISHQYYEYLNYLNIKYNNIFDFNVYKYSYNFIHLLFLNAQPKK